MAADDSHAPSDSPAGSVALQLIRSASRAVRWSADAAPAGAASPSSPAGRMSVVVPRAPQRGRSVRSSHDSASTSLRSWGGGRWSAVYSLWTYAHHLLHLLGFTAVDHEEVALLSAPLVRIRSARSPRLVLAHAQDPLYPAEPLGLVPAAEASLEQTLFLVHFVGPANNPVVAPDPAGAEQANCARPATAFPTDKSPRAWIAVDHKSGYLSLTIAEANAAVFDVRPASTSRGNSSSRHGAEVTLYLNCAAGNYLSAGSPDTARVRVCQSVEGKTEVFCINTMPMTPCRLSGLNGSLVDPNEATLADALQRTRNLPVRLQSVAHRWFVASSPGAPLAAASKKETGWDAFIIEFDHSTSMARIRDSRGLYLVLAPDFRSFTSAITRDDPSRAAAVLGARSIAAPAPAIVACLSSRSSLGNPLASQPGLSTRSSSEVSSGSSSLCSQGPPGSPGLSQKALSSTGSVELGQMVPQASLSVGPGSSMSDDVDTEAKCVGDLPRAERFVVTVHDHEDCITLRSRKGYLSACSNGAVRVSQNTKPGIRELFYLRLALPSMMDQSSPSLRLRHYAHGVREVDASIVIPASAAVAYSVLRDYDGFHRFIEDCSDSSLEERKPDGTLVVRMCQAHSFLVLTITMTMVLKAQEDDLQRKVSMDLIHGLGVKTYKGMWHAVERPDGRCGLHVKISSSPSVPAPNFLVDGVMTHAVTSTLEQIRSECILRSARISE